MTNGKHLDPILEKALNLDGSTQSINSFYAGWAQTYDQKTSDWHYVAPRNALKMMYDLAEDEALTINPQNKQLKIMDAGCGTGQVGLRLNQQGYSNIDGFDLCNEMISIARSTHCYKQLQGGIDINQPIKLEWQKAYDCTFCMGVFTPGHVAPQAINQLQALTRQNGLILLSTRVAYYESENFQAISNQMQKTGQLKLLARLNDASYTKDSRAHYWAYAVLQ